MTPTRAPGPIPSSPRISPSGRDRSRGWLGRLRSWNRWRRIGSGAAPAMPQHSLPTRIGRLAVGPDDQDGLLEARIEAGQVRQVGAVLAVGVDDEPIVAARLHPLAQPRRAGPAYSARPGSPVVSSGIAEVGQRRRRPARGRVVVTGRCLLAASTVGSRRRRARSGRTCWPATVCHGPTSPSGHVTRTSAGRRRRRARSGSSRAAPLACPPPTVTSRWTIRSPTRTSTHGADRVAVRRPAGSSSTADPVAHRRRRLGRARPDVAPHADVLATDDHDEVQQAVEVEVDQRRAAGPREIDDARPPRRPRRTCRPAWPSNRLLGSCAA